MRTITGANSAFWERLQGDTMEIAEVIRLDHANLKKRWTTNNETITRSGEEYKPFPGQSEGGVEESSDLSVAVAGFVFANSGGEFDVLLHAANFDMATVIVERVFTDTPDLGSIEIFRGLLGDLSYTRTQISGEARTQWGGKNQNWPYHAYKDTCSWRFGSQGCGVDVSSFTLTFSGTQIASGTAIAMVLTGTTLTQSYSNGFFDFGKLTFLTGPNSGEVRTIRTHSGNLLGLSHKLPYTANTGDFSVYPGCRKRWEADCTSKYNNEGNFLGFKWIPIQEDLAASG